MPERRESKVKKDMRRFIRLPFGDSQTTHYIWESKAYREATENDLLPNITEELVFQYQSVGEEAYAKLRNGISYHRTEVPIIFKGQTWWSITERFEGKIVREIRPVLPNDFYAL